MKTYTSRLRFDESRGFLGVFEQMGRVQTDADHNEQVRIGLTDRQRRVAALAEGSPDDGFRISDAFTLDAFNSTMGWTGVGLAADDERVIRRELTLERRETNGLPHVLYSRGHSELQRQLPRALDLNELPVGGGRTLAAASIIVRVRFERPPTDDELVDIELVFGSADGALVSRPAGVGQAAHSTSWRHLVVPVGELAGLDLSRFDRWGLRGLPPRAAVSVDALSCTLGGLAPGSFVIRGGDGTVAGGGRIFVNGLRAVLPGDTLYDAQPDYPDAPTLASLEPNSNLRHLVYLDLWELTVTSLDDPWLLESALDGEDTSSRQRLVQQVRVVQNVADCRTALLPTATGGGLISTNVPEGRPNRYPSEAWDPCRDRCLQTESASTGVGYTGSENIHVRVEVLHRGERPIVLWSRDNAYASARLVADAPVGSSTVQLAPEDTERFRAGDLVTIEDRVTALRAEGPRHRELRRVRSVNVATGMVEFDDESSQITDDPEDLLVGGGLTQAWSRARGARLRRWDGADWLLTGIRYNLSDGITFTLDGDRWRNGDYWTFVARVLAPDGAARGWVESLDRSPVHGPVHSYVKLACIGPGSSFEDLRPRYLPLHEVRDRLIELSKDDLTPGAFTVVVGDGVTTFGDVDQNLAEGVTGDEAIQTAVNRLSLSGGTIYIRKGQYQLEHPVLMEGMSRIRILGDGPASELLCVGAGGAFYVDHCGHDGAVSIELLRMVEDPNAETVIGDRSRGIDEATVLAGSYFTSAMLRTDGAASDTFYADLAATYRGLEPGKGRAAASVVATLRQLRRLQRLNPGATLEDLPAARDLLTVLRRLPHGVVGIADSRQVRVSRCDIVSVLDTPESAGIFVTGRVDGLELRENRIHTFCGVVAAPYAPYLARSMLSLVPRSGLYLCSVVIEGNRVQGRGQASCGIHLADGELDGIHVSGNRVEDYVVGILVEDLEPVRRSVALDRILLADNQVIGARAVGVRVCGDGTDISGNEIRNAHSDALLRAGIQVVGQGVRVRDCWVELPRGRGPVLGVHAGILVGEGVVQSDVRHRPVWDVEVRDTRIEGGADDAIGILIGGRQPISTVSVHGCTLRELGGAGVRTWACGGPVGNLRVEGNTFERVEQRPPVTSAAVMEQLALLSSAAAERLRNTNPRTPRALLDAALANIDASMEVALDAGSRWLQRNTMRGAVVVANVAGCTVANNEIRNVGLLWAAEFDIEQPIHTAAVFAVGGSDLCVRDNRIEGVRAPFERVVVPEPSPPVRVSRGVERLRKLGRRVRKACIDERSLHASVVSLRVLLNNYVRGDEHSRQSIGRRVYGPMNSITNAFRRLGGRAERLAEQLELEAGQMRSAQSRDDHSRTATQVRATLSRAAAFTAADDRAGLAWDTAHQFDLAAGGGEAVSAAARRIDDGLESLTAGTDLLAGLRSDLRQVAESNNPSLDEVCRVSEQLGRLGVLRDTQAEHDRMRPTQEVFGRDRTAIETFAKAVASDVESLAEDDGAANRSVLLAMRKNVDILSASTQRGNERLSRQLERTFRKLERPDGRVNTDERDQMHAVVGRIRSWVCGEAMASGDAIDDFELEQTAQQNEVALQHLLANDLVEQLQKLTPEHQDLRRKRLGVIRPTLEHLRRLLGEDSPLSEMVSKAGAAIGRAIDDPAALDSELSQARNAMTQLRARLGERIDAPSMKTTQPIVAMLHPRLSALGETLITLRELDDEERQEGLELFTNHFRVLLDETGYEAGACDTVVEELEAASSVLLRRSASRETQDAAVFRMARLLEDVGSNAAQVDTSPQVQATSVLLRATALSLDPDTAEGTRLQHVAAYLDGRSSWLAQPTIADIGKATVAAELLDKLRYHFDRIGTCETPTIPEVDEPTYPRDPWPADAVFTAGVGGRLEVSRNRAAGVVRAIHLRGSNGHVFARCEAEQVQRVDVNNNHIERCALEGIHIVPDGSTVVSISNNHLSACAAHPYAGRFGFGQAVICVAGRGEVSVRGNEMRSNGHGLVGALVHELVVHWHGNVVVRSNSIRHGGGGLGGVGMLLVVGMQADRSLVQRLAYAHHLAVEPVPASVPASKPTEPLQATEPVMPSTFGQVVELNLGGLKQTVQPYKTAFRARAERKEFVHATTSATFTPGNGFELAAPKSELLTLVSRHPILPIIPIRPIEEHVVHVECNDVLAQGPALLVLSEEQDLVDLSVVTNELTTDQATGAVYLRNPDSVVFTGNRCECRRAVTVATIRPGRSLVTASSNVLIGAEPVVTRIPMVRVNPLPTFNGWVLADASKNAEMANVSSSGAYLAVQHQGRSLKVPLSSNDLYAGLIRNKEVRKQAFADTVRAYVENNMPPQSGGETPVDTIDPLPGPDPEQEIPNEPEDVIPDEPPVEGPEAGPVLEDVILPEGPRMARPLPTKPGAMGTGRLATPIEEISRLANLAASERVIEAARGSIGIKRLYDRFDPHAAIESKDELAYLKEAVDLLALNGMPGDDLGAQVSEVVKAAGSAKGAVKVIKEEILGSDRAPVVERHAKSNALLEAIAESVFSGAASEAVGPVLSSALPFAEISPGPHVSEMFQIPAPPPPPAKPVPPASSDSDEVLECPTAHTLVIHGGEKVCAIANATTAGVLVSDARSIVELNNP